MNQPVPACPQCDSADAVHSVQELAALAAGQLGTNPPGSPAQGWAAEPQSGPVPGWAAEPQAGPPPGPGRRRTASFRDRETRSGVSPLDALGEDVAGAAISAAVGFAARAIGRRLQRTMAERVVPAVASQQEVLRTQIEIAQRHPDLCACLTDQVVFLAGGSRVLPMPNLMTVTVPQADELVARLRDG